MSSQAAVQTRPISDANRARNYRDRERMKRDAARAIAPRILVLADELAAMKEMLQRAGITHERPPQGNGKSL